MSHSAFSVFARSHYVPTLLPLNDDSNRNQTFVTSTRQGKHIYDKQNKIIIIMHIYTY
jgi:hypothetical protein